MRRLIEALRLLAAHPMDQRNALPEFVCVPDELALIFDDELRVSAGEVAELPSTIREALAGIDAELDAMSERPELWNPESLDRASEWATVREHARRVLADLGEEVISPNLTWLTYTR